MKPLFFLFKSLAFITIITLFSCRKETDTPQLLNLEFVAEKGYVAQDATLGRTSTFKVKLKASAKDATVTFTSLRLTINGEPMQIEDPTLEQKQIFIEEFELTVPEEKGTYDYVFILSGSRGIPVEARLRIIAAGKTPEVTLLQGGKGYISTDIVTEGGINVAFKIKGIMGDAPIKTTQLVCENCGDGFYYPEQILNADYQKGFDSYELTYRLPITLGKYNYKVILKDQDGMIGETKSVQVTISYVTEIVKSYFQLYNQASNSSASAHFYSINTGLSYSQTEADKAYKIIDLAYFQENGKNYIANLTDTKLLNIYPNIANWLVQNETYFAPVNVKFDQVLTQEDMVVVLEDAKWFSGSIEVVLSGNIAFKTASGTMGILNISQLNEKEGHFVGEIKVLTQTN